MYSARESVLALLAEADERIDDFKKSVQAYSAKSCRIVRDDDLQVGKAHYRLQDVVQPPIGISVKLLGISDYIRSPLDHLVSNLIANHGTAPATKNPSFPVCVTENEWKEAKGKIKGIDSAAEAALRAIQPFEQHEGGDPEEHPLALLQSLSNLTKHTLVLFVQITVTESTRHRIHAGYRINWSELFVAPFEDGAEVAVLIPGKPSEPGQVVVLDMGSFGRGTRGFPTNFGALVPGEGVPEGFSEGMAYLKAGSGPWEQSAWDDFFTNVKFDLKLSQTILFGPGTKRLERLPVIETINGIRYYIDNHVFQKGGLIERLV